MVRLCVGTHGRTMMRTMDKRTVDYDLMPDTVLYDVFYESGTMLGGAYVARMRAATDAFERERWRRALSGLDSERASIAYDDRKGQIAAKRRWDAERKALVAADGRK